MLTWGEAKRILAKYAGVGGACPTDPDVDLFTRKVLQFLLISGASQDLRRFDFIACKGVFTVPEEVEAIIKLRVNGRVGNSWDKWYSYHNQNFLEGDCICPPSNAVFEDPNYYATAYDIPSGGSKVGVLGHCKEDCDAHIIVQGKDLSGRQIFTVHKGEQISGEYLSITKGMLTYSQVTFATIDNIIKTKTNGYATLYAVKPDCNTKSFLSDYTPLDEHPTYRRYRLTSPDCCPYASVSILARVRLKNSYSDLDRIPFENILAIETAGQMANSSFNDDLQTAGAKLQLVDSLVQREQSHKKVQTGIPINISPVTGPGRVMNVVGGRGCGLWGNFVNGRNGR